jgi:hypothetical protein
MNGPPATAAGSETVARDRHVPEAALNLKKEAVANARSS